MLPLDVVSLNGSFSMLLLPHLTGKMLVVESILAGGNGDAADSYDQRTAAFILLAGEKVGTSGGVVAAVFAVGRLIFVIFVFNLFPYYSVRFCIQHMFIRYLT
jgi:hypothetical protein